MLEILLVLSFPVARLLSRLPFGPLLNDAVSHFLFLCIFLSIGLWSGWSSFSLLGLDRLLEGIHSLCFELNVDGYLAVGVCIDSNIEHFMNENFLILTYIGILISNFLWLFEINERICLRFCI
jgi:hypothetical protein